MQAETRKLASKFIGPSEIEKVINRSVVQLKLPASLKVHPTFKVSLIKPDSLSFLSRAQITSFITTNSLNKQFKTTFVPWLSFWVLKQKDFTFLQALTFEVAISLCFSKNSIFMFCQAYKHSMKRHTAEQQQWLLRWSKGQFIFRLKTFSLLKQMYHNSIYYKQK